jgi:uncharacterized protein involved in exopolysaccharide biosynthesis
MNNELKFKQETDGFEFDLKDIILPIWSEKRIILISAIFCGFVGAVLSFLTPTTYIASTTFLPQTSQSGGGEGSLGGLAAIAGINIGSGAMLSGEISPSLYSMVLESSPFKKRILDSKIWVKNDSISYRDYLSNQPISSLSIIQKYTTNLPGTILSALSKPSDYGENLNDSTGLIELDDREYNLQSSLSGKIIINHNKKEGFVGISVEEADPIIAAQVTNITKSILQKWIIEHKIKNTKAQYDFIEKQFEAKQKEFFSIQEQLANYTDRNQNVLAASYLTRLDRLQAEFDLVNTVYSELAKQKEQAAIQLSKDTPTFSVLNPVSVPREKAGMRKSLFVLIGFSIGFFSTAIWSITRKPLGIFINEIRESIK